MIGDGERTANVRAMAVPAAALERLLDRRNADGGLAPADPALIAAAIRAARAEVRRVAVMLEHMAADPTDPDRPQIAAMTAGLVYLSGTIERLERMLGDLRD